MKIIKTTQGEIAIILNQEEVTNLIALTGMTELSTETGGGENRYKNLQKNTRDFLDDFKKKFGASIVDRKDPVLKELIYKHRLGQLSLVLKIFIERGYATVTYVGEGKAKKIKTLQIK